MKGRVTIGLVGDRSDSVPAHLAIPQVLENAAETLGIAVAYRVGAHRTHPVRESRRVVRRLVVRAGQPLPQHGGRADRDPLRTRRTYPVSRHVRRLSTRRHRIRAQRSRLAGRSARRNWIRRATVAVISPLSCPLVNVGGSVQLLAGTRIATAYGTDEATEVYFCRYGVNPDFRASLIAGPLREAARDDTGDLRAVELDDHPFFVATLFQPERAAAARQAGPARERISSPRARAVIG